MSREEGTEHGLIKSIPPPQSLALRVHEIKAFRWELASQKACELFKTMHWFAG